MKALKIKAVAELLDTSEGWVYNHAQELGGVKIGGKWLFTERGLENALQVQDKRGNQAQRNGTGQEGTIHTLRLSKTGRGNRMGSRDKETLEERREGVKRYNLDRLL